MTAMQLSAVAFALSLAAAVLAVVIVVTADQGGHHVSDRQVRRLCATYAGLDLDALAPLCERVGYQQQVQP